MHLEIWLRAQEIICYRVSLSPAGGESGHNPALREQEYQGDRQAGQHRGRREITPQVLLLVEEEFGTDRERQVLLWCNSIEATGYSIMPPMNANTNTTIRIGTAMGSST
jgi:hypothetical protein